MVLQGKLCGRVGCCQVFFLEPHNTRNRDVRLFFRLLVSAAGALVSAAGALVSAAGALVSAAGALVSGAGALVSAAGADYAAA